MIKPASSLIFILAVLAGCSSSAPKLESTVKYERQGSRSKARNSFLSAEGFRLPDCFTAVLSGESLYLFKTRSRLWGDSGYVREDISLTDKYFPEDKGSIPEEAVKRGWAETKGKCSVPKGWFFVSWDGGWAALLPEKAEEMARVKNLKPIPRFSPVKGKKGTF